ncbi:MAG: hypothetical protein ACLQDF_03455 [Desulfomonilia bacterium]
MIILYVFLLCTSCVMMKDLDHAYTNKDIQSGLKEMGGLVDTLKFQNDERYTYRIISINARDMVNLSETLSRKALDSYFRRQVRKLGEQAEDLYTASSRSNADATKATIEEILKTWEIIQEYKKPA